MDQKPQEDRRQSQKPYQGDERRKDDGADQPKKYAAGEMPKDPTPGDPGEENVIERGRLDRGDEPPRGGS